MAAYINSHPLISEVQWQSSTVAELDLRNSNVSRLILHPQGLQTVRLNDGLSILILNGAPSPALRIDDPHAGRFLRLQLSGDLAPFHGLDQLARLSLSAMPAVDFAAVARRFPQLVDLAVWWRSRRCSNTTVPLWMMDSLWGAKSVAFRWLMVLLICGSCGS